MKIDCVCPVCNKNFKKYPSQIKSKYTFCSSKCKYIGRSLGFEKRNVIKPYNIKISQKKRILKNCKICNKQFEITTSRESDNLRGKYCSRKCFEIAHKKNMKGKNNPSWIDGRSYNKRGFRGDNWDFIRMKVYKRDHFRCQKCGVKCIGRNKINEINGFLLIQCHHKDGDKENNELNNLETLCVKCHGKK